MVFNGFRLVSMVFFRVDSWFFMILGLFPWFFKVVSWFLMVLGWFQGFFKVSRWIFIVINGPRLV